MHYTLSVPCFVWSLSKPYWYRFASHLSFHNRKSLIVIMVAAFRSNFLSIFRLILSVYSRAASDICFFTITDIIIILFFLIITSHILTFKNCTQGPVTVLFSSLVQQITHFHTRNILHLIWTNYLALLWVKYFTCLLISGRILNM